MKHLLIFLFLSCAVLASAQMRIKPEWTVLKPDGPTGNAESWSVSVDTDGNLFWSYNQTGDGYDVFLEKRSRTNPLLIQSIYTYSAPFAQQAYVTKQQAPLLFL